MCTRESSSTAAICFPSGLKSSARSLDWSAPSLAVKCPVDVSKTSTRGRGLYGSI